MFNWLYSIVPSADRLFRLSIVEIIQLRELEPCADENNLNEFGMMPFYVRQIIWTLIERPNTDNFNLD